MTDLMPRPDDAGNGSDALNTDYTYRASFLAYSLGLTTNPRQAELTLKLGVGKAWREAAEVVDKLEMIVCRFDLWVPSRLLETGEDDEV